MTPKIGSKEYKALVAGALRDLKEARKRLRNATEELELAELEHLAKQVREVSRALEMMPSAGWMLERFPEWFRDA